MSDSHGFPNLISSNLDFRTLCSKIGLKSHVPTQYCVRVDLFLFLKILFLSGFLSFFAYRWLIKYSFISIFNIINKKIMPNEFFYFGKWIAYNHKFPNNNGLIILFSISLGKCGDRVNVTSAHLLRGGPRYLSQQLMEHVDLVLGLLRLPR